MRPVCVPCQRFFRVKKIGYYFIEAMPRSDSPFKPPLPGTEMPEHWTPYKLWVGDLMECEDCGAQIVSGFGNSPISEHYKPEFVDMVQRLGADQLTVNDC